MTDEVDINLAGKFRVLVADDSLSVRSTLHGRLSKRGFKVDLAENGTDALAMVKGGGFDLLITDYQMPGLNGLDLAQKVKALFPKLPICFITGDPDFIGAEVPPHVDRLITKPFHADTLCDIVEALLTPGVSVPKI